MYIFKTHFSESIDPFWDEYWNFIVFANTEEEAYNLIKKNFIERVRERGKNSSTSEDYTNFSISDFRSKVKEQILYDLKKNKIHLDKSDVIHCHVIDQYGNELFAD